MTEEKNKINTSGRGLTDYTPVTQSVSEKVANTVATFFNEEPVKVPATEKQPKKVANMVGTFLNEGRNGFQYVVSESVEEKTTKVEPEKVANMVGTFYGC